jgi:hypothetical protein
MEMRESFKVLPLLLLVLVGGTFNSRSERHDHQLLGGTEPAIQEILCRVLDWDTADQVNRILGHKKRPHVLVGREIWSADLTRFDQWWWVIRVRWVKDLSEGILGQLSDKRRKTTITITHRTLPHDR